MKDKHNNKHNNKHNRKDENNQRDKRKEKYISFNRKVKRFYITHDISPRFYRSTQSKITNILTSEKDVDYIECNYGGAVCLFIKKKDVEIAKGTMLYCHGGGYNTGDLEYCKILGGKLAKVSKMNVISFLYPLTPENPYPTQLLTAVKVYKDVLLEFGEIDVIAGDSAGGHLALSLVQKIKNTDISMPKKLILMSPWTDLTLSGESYKTKKDVDVSLTPEYMEYIRKCFCKTNDYKSPLISPVFANFTNFPKTLIQVGTDEILLWDSLMLFDNMRKYNVNVKIDIHEKAGHVFQMFPEKVMPQEAKAMIEIEKFLLN